MIAGRYSVVIGVLLIPVHNHKHGVASAVPMRHYRT
jgi:hypothetical protein